MKERRHFLPFALSSLQGPPSICPPRSPCAPTFLQRPLIRCLVLPCVPIQPLRLLSSYSCPCTDLPSKSQPHVLDPVYPSQLICDDSSCRCSVVNESNNLSNLGHKATNDLSLQLPNLLPQTHHEISYTPLTRRVSMQILIQFSVHLSRDR